MRAREIQMLIEGHKRRYTDKEADLFNKVEKFYNGNFFAIDNKARSFNDGQSTDPRSSLNLFYMVVDNMLYMLLGQDIAVAANGHTPEAHQIQAHVSRLITEQFRANDMREVSGIAVANAAAKRRGCFKTIFDPIAKKPKIFSVEPSHVGYDPNAKVYKESRYWTNLVEMPWRMFKKRVEMGVYKRPGKLADAIKPDKTPTWAKKQDELASRYADEVFGVALVWEIYDMDAMKAYHWHETTGSIVWEGNIDDQPLSMFSFNHNMRNLDGISELELIIPQQEAINNINTTMHQVVHRILPRIMFDAGMIDFNELSNVMHAPAGSYAGIRMTAPQGKSLRDAFMDTPTAKLDPQLPAFRDLMIADANLITGLTEQSRGGSENIRTAREAAMIDANSRSRLAYREGNFRAAISKVGERCVRLLQKYGHGPYTVKEQDVFMQLDQLDLRRFDGHFDIAPYSPVKNNPELLADIIGKMSNYLVGNPMFDQEIIADAIVDGLGLPTHVKLPVEARQQPQQGIEQMAAASDQAAEAPPETGSPDQAAVQQAAQEMG